MRRHRTRDRWRLQRLQSCPCWFDRFFCHSCYPGFRRGSQRLQLPFDAEAPTWRERETSLIATKLPSKMEWFIRAFKPRLPKWCRRFLHESHKLSGFFHPKSFTKLNSIHKYGDETEGVIRDHCGLETLENDAWRWLIITHSFVVMLVLKEMTSPMHHFTT